MTKDEFNAILAKTHAQAIKRLSEAINESNCNDMPSFISTVCAISIEAAEDSVLQALSEAGFISFTE